ncbi:MAG: hypothetical protein N0C84_01250 [Candidatus Thiodiazotropha taylori]|uniref:Capsule polysaccharide biosynthesis protein n=1 Tax=Candidatus Thiodiazotropha taylori TaxID=2792791 RepID=A0A9E4KA78_9GAMM|nr:hypothetical protein [Candidatus Thiodiazotropha taylori]MCW4255073.1 hypothetical protein [Candidatus Thiodiazotropha taylori]
MKLKLYKEFGSINSKPIFAAFEEGAIAVGDEIVETYDEADAVVIWSILFSGRMRGNKDIWQRANRDKKPIIVLEVGSLLRDTSWRVGLGGINRDARWGIQEEVSSKRRAKFNIDLKPWREGGEFITICTQRPDSHQWANMVPMEQWLDENIRTIQEQTARPIVIRPHPRDKLTNFKAVHQKHSNVYFDVPKHLGVSDHYNFSDILDRSYMVINHSSTPGIESIINGVPAIVGKNSMAYEMSSDINNINTPYMPYRDKWFDGLLHTEWFEDEIKRGLPWARLKPFL